MNTIQTGHLYFSRNLFRLLEMYYDKTQNFLYFVKKVAIIILCDYTDLKWDFHIK